MSPAPIVSTTRTSGTCTIPEVTSETKRTDSAPLVIATFVTPQSRTYLSTSSSVEHPGGEKSAEQIAVSTLLRSSWVPFFQLPPSNTTWVPRTRAALAQTWHACMK